MDILIENVFEAFRDSVKHSPAGDRVCDQLQTFRVFPNSRLPELSTPNLGVNICEKDRPFFWSRKWVEAKYNPSAVKWQFPLLYVFDMSAQIEKPFLRGAKSIHALQIGVLDVLSDDCADGKCNGCNGRTINEIYIDTQRLLLQSLRYVRQIVHATTTPGTGTLPPGWYHKEYLEYLKNAGIITAFNPTKQMFAATEAANNNGVFAARRERPTEKFYGTAIEMNVITSACYENNPDFAPYDWGAVAHNIGCQNCQ